MKTLKTVCHTINIGTNSLQEVNTRYENFKANKLPKNAVNLCTEFTIEDDYDGDHILLLECYYDIPYTEGELKIIAEQQAAIEKRNLEKKRTIYEQLKKEFGDA